MTLDSRAERQSYQDVASRIMQLIADTGLKPGDRLPTERELVSALGVSRHKISQAVKALEVSGVLHPQQGSGVYVTSTSPPTATGIIDVTVRGNPRQVEQLCEFRMTLEMQTARLAAERTTPRQLRVIEEAALGAQSNAENHEAWTRADTDFHMGIAQATGNEYLISAVSTVIRLQFWAGDRVMGNDGGTPGNPFISAEQHLKIFQAIRDGNPDAAALCMQEHIQTFLKNYLLEVSRRMNSDLLIP